MRSALTRNYRIYDRVEIERHGIRNQEIVNAIYEAGLYEFAVIYGPRLNLATSGIHHGLLSDENWPEQRNSHYRVSETMMISSFKNIMARGERANSQPRNVIVIDGNFPHSDNGPYADSRNFVSWGTDNRFD